MTADFFIIVPYFNPYEFKTRRDNLERCISSLRTLGADFAVAEVLFPLQESVVRGTCNSFTFKSDCVLWQKERIINASLDRLDKKYTKIAWVDSNVVFIDQNWIQSASELLKRMQVVQLFSSVIESANYPQKPAKSKISSVASLLQNGTLNDSAWGYAWAARRELLETVGLYDRLIAGGGSLAWIYALILGRGSRFLWAKAALENKLFANMSKSLCNDYMSWAEKVSESVGEQIGVINNRIEAFWHYDGYPLNLRSRIYSHFDFERSVCVDAEGCWNWDKKAFAVQELAGQVKEMFLRREEDG